MGRRLSQLCPPYAAPSSNSSLDYRRENGFATSGGLSKSAKVVLEPISKLPEEDNEASELYEAEEVLGVVFPTDEDTALPLNPSKEALYEPASHIAAWPSPILRGRLASVAAMRRDHLDAVLAQLLIEWIAIVGAIANQILRLGLDHVEVEAGEFDWRSRLR